MWSLKANIALNHVPVNPVIIPNAVDPEIFNHIGRVGLPKNRKIRIISTSWSPNVRKGWEVYKWLDENLDWDKYEYTFIGSIPGEFKNIRHVKPMGSEQLAEQLKAHDVYIVASKNDPCSNALIEALACGLPTLYLNSGGHEELVGFGGLSFNKAREIPRKLEALVANYESFQRLIGVEDISDITRRYIELFTRTGGLS
jgi:glycosyltransferase involved in cell wall biosynthesis